MYDADRTLALRSWLTAGANPVRRFDELCEETGKKLRPAGLPVDQFALYTLLLHPELPGIYAYWTEAAGCHLFTFTPEQLQSPKIWIGSAAYQCGQIGRMIDHKFGSSPEYDERTENKMLYEKGYTQFVYTPLHSKYTPRHSVAAYGTKSKNGFSAEEVHAFRLMQAPLARVVEAIVLYESTVQILSTFVGRDGGARVLRGNILRGDAEAIPSIVLFADLCDFTTLSNTRPASDVIQILNKFFDAAGRAIARNGGEILKFMGDGLLAIFPTPDDVSAQLAAALNAISAIEETSATLKNEAEPSIRFRAALDVGDIFYGNIGSTTRLDFTAIGPTVNRAARLLNLAEPLGANVVCSDTFHRLLPSRTSSLGEHSFKGFEQPQGVYKVGI